MSLNDTRTPTFSKTKNYRKAWRLTLLIFIYFSVLLINGLDEFIRSGFALDFVFTPEWWYKVFRVLFSNILIFVGTLMYLIDLAVRNRPDILKKKSELEKIIDNNLDATTFDPWYLNFERNRKIKYYKKALRNKITILDSDAKMHEIKLWTKQLKNTDDEDEELYNKWLDCKYCQKKNTLYEQLQDDFIEENIDYIDVPYRPNSKSFVTDGYNKPSDKFDEYAVEPKSSKLLWDLFPKFAIMAGFLIAGESIIVEFSMTESIAVALFNMIIKVVPLFIQVYYAFTYSDAYIDEKIMVDLRKRSDIMVKYLSATNKKGVENNG